MAVYWKGKRQQGLTGGWQQFISETVHVSKTWHVINLRGTETVLEKKKKDQQAYGTEQMQCFPQLSI